MRHSAPDVSPDTRQRLLDAAERLFASRGFEATSLRHVTAEAGANLAAVHYHFGSKEALIGAVFTRILEPVTARQLAALEKIEQGADPPTVEEVVHAFVDPAVHLHAAGGSQRSTACRLLARCYADPDMEAHSLINRHAAATLERFVRAFQRALPHLQEQELLWRLHFTVGALAHSLAGGERLRELSGGACDPADARGMLGRLVAYVAAGLRAPAGDDQ
jgi:AcrR family transcriptional regulator